MEVRRALSAVAVAVAAAVAVGLVAGRRAVAAAPIPVDGKFEIAFDVPGTTAANADDVVIDAAFTAPSGRQLHVGGFFDGARFAVRFSPSEPGRWRYEVRASHHAVAAGAFDAGPRVGHGRLRRDPAAPHRLVFSDGTPFHPLGENRFNVYDPTWNYQQQSIEQYLAAMHRAGMSTLRIFVICDCDNEEAPDHVQRGCLETAPGRFSPRAAALYDRVVAAAEANDVYVVFGVWAIGFTQHETWKSWDDNPYSRARGGPAASPVEFFTRADLRRIAARKLAYIAARWGYSSHLFAVDLLNEPEWDGAIAEDVWIPWAEAMAAAWRRVDVYAHLVTAGSVGLQWNIRGDERPWYASGANDLVEWHLYGKETYEVHALADTLLRKVAETWRYDKPIFVGEFAYGGEAKPLYDHTHVGLWTATFAGAGALMHSAPAFNLDSDEPMTPERARHAAGLARFLARLSPSPHTPSTLAAAPAGTRALALANGDEVALWVLAPERGYGQPVDGARVTLRDLRAGQWRARFYDELSGEPRDEVTLLASDGRVELTLPRFTRHTCAIVSRVLHADAHP